MQFLQHQQPILCHHHLHYLLRATLPNLSRYVNYRVKLNRLCFCVVWHAMCFQLLSPDETDSTLQSLNIAPNAYRKNYNTLIKNSVPLSYSKYLSKVRVLIKMRLVDLKQKFYSFYFFRPVIQRPQDLSQVLVLLVQRQILILYQKQHLYRRLLQHLRRLTVRYLQLVST